MSVDEKTVRRVARLARLAIPEERLAPMAGELNAILAWVEQLQELDTSSVEPMTSAEGSTSFSATKRGFGSIPSPIGWRPMCSTPPASVTS